MSERVYVVTDIEVDGFVPGANSMLALASVAVTASGEQVGEFEAVLAGLPGAQADPRGWEWFQTQPPEVVAAATAAPRPVADVMADFVSWVKGPGGGDPATFSVHTLPAQWFGDVPHTHRAIDDARGYAHLLVEVLRRSRERATLPDPA
ncbi:hypothetical protein KDN32_13430 [Nocardioides sp. J2M5]|uniref:hypothetical protein n=1 Tax=Nocardioides palaemonis TaxID=2829810 RepID=UPI001BA7BC72|nr:hypothetical protein [Nocardioides palaemonis]MBS2938738.1 hypothetical protein [Nocardioides palaemonis]